MRQQTTISRQGHAGATAEEILTLVGSTDGFTAINPHRTADPRLEITPFGPPRGVGAGFAFRGKGGTGRQTVTETTERFVAYAIDMGSMGTSTQRITAVAAPRGGCDVTWTMTLDAGRNPLRRLFGLVANRVLGPTLETGIHNLSHHEAR